MGWNRPKPRPKPAHDPLPRRYRPQEHFCEAPGCSAWGAFGFGFSAETRRWFCGAHRALGDHSL